ncbi:fibroleukin-like isoform X3 [Lucilia sericata]|uniref:fibroleukin-like isoform X3 n=1 Tax=Lucilia sericata TaxID=13632 RepID=UPI0018A82E46|nr:fibroleukin-like isoform X3 [Lucilia sericata]
MKLKKYLTTKVFILIVVNLFNFANSSQILTNNDFAPEEGADLELDDPWLRAQKYEQNVLVMEEKIKYLSETFDQLELKMHTLIKDNMELLEKNLQQIIDEKITNINQVAEEKMKIINNAKLTYNVNEVKCSNNRLPKSCQDLNECNSNIYSIMVPDISNKPLPAVCDLKTFDGGWTVIQRRQDGSENFFRNWTDYVEGFGNLNGEFFIGLEKLYALTSLDEPQELYITLEDFDGQERYAKYGLFKVDSNSTDYILTIVIMMQKKIKIVPITGREHGGIIIVFIAT